MNHDDVSESFLTADRLTDTHIDRHTTHTLHTHGRERGVHAVQIGHHTYTHTGWANKGENKGRGAETQGYTAPAQGPKGGFGYTNWK